MSFVYVLDYTNASSKWINQPAFAVSLHALAMSKKRGAIDVADMAN